MDNPEMTEEVEKPDPMELVQEIHDKAVELGATCGPAAEPEMPEDAAKTLITFGGELKALGGGKFGGYLVRFSSPADPDLTGDYFTPETDFDMAFPGKSSVYFNHGLDAKMQRRKLGAAELRQDEIGIWAETILQERDEYERYIAQMAVSGKMGWSSGTASHLVERKGTGQITKWPLGLDASLTHTPAEPRNMVMPLKSFNPPVAVETAQVDTNPQPKEEPIMSDELKALQDEVASLRKLIEDAPAIKKAPAHLKLDRGDDEVKAFTHWARTGDGGGIDHLKASNATDMDSTTGANGNYVVPTGMLQQVIARRDQSDIASMLGVRQIPGVGKTVNVPLDGEADGEFVATAEATTTDKDTPAMGQKAMTLVKYTKYIPMSWELIDYEDASLLTFMADWVGRGLAKTRNSLLLTEVASNGTSLKTFASASAFALGELEAMAYGVDLAAYLDDPSVAWVMRSPTYATIASTGGTSLRYYASQEANSGLNGPSILGYKVAFTDKAAAIAASAKSVYFGNWNYVGQRNGVGLTMLRDPYSRATYGQVLFHYYFETVFGVLQAEAIGYGAHPTA